MVFPLSVHWHKNPQNNEWFDFLKLSLDAPYFKDPLKKGVFMIWYISPTGSRVIKIGSGNIGEQLRNARQNPVITDYSKLGTLKISWIAANGVMSTAQIEGVELFLNMTYGPILSEKSVTTQLPIPVALLQ